jgi:hypothetical protein
MLKTPLNLPLNQCLNNKNIIEQLMKNTVPYL